VRPRNPTIRPAGSMLEEVGSMLNLADALVAAAEARQESRGGHQRSDFSARNDRQRISHTVVTMGQGTPRTDTKPVVAL
jgi:succinate dehydrogenase/fumarate reductase flavoprotein subunit